MDVASNGIPDANPTDSASGLVRILVVEDDENEAAALVSCLKRYEKLHCQPFTISVTNTAFEIIDTVPDADIMFMDIGLPGINGMEAAGMLRMRGVRTPIIFITSLAQYAASSYEVDALDFMVKPVKYESFALRMDRALRVIRRTLGRSIVVKTKEGLRVLPITTITAITVDGHTIRYHQTDGTEFVARGVKLSTGEEYPISRPKRKDVLLEIANYFGGSKRS